MAGDDFTIHAMIVHIKHIFIKNKTSILGSVCLTKYAQRDGAERNMREQLEDLHKD